MWKVECFRLKNSGCWDTVFVEMLGDLEEDELADNLSFYANHLWSDATVHMGIYHYEWIDE